MTRSELLEILYPDPWEEPDFPEWSRDVLITRLREKVPGLIRCDHGRGFVIDFPGFLECEAA